MPIFLERNSRAPLAFTRSNGRPPTMKEPSLFSTTDKGVAIVYGKVAFLLYVLSSCCNYGKGIEQDCSTGDSSIAPAFVDPQDHHGLRVVYMIIVKKPENWRYTSVLVHARAEYMENTIPTVFSHYIKSACANVMYVNTLMCVCVCDCVLAYA